MILILIPEDNRVPVLGAISQNKLSIAWSSTVQVPYCHFAVFNGYNLSQNNSYYVPVLIKLTQRLDI